MMACILKIEERSMGVAEGGNKNARELKRRPRALATAGGALGSHFSVQAAKPALSPFGGAEAAWLGGHIGCRNHALAALRLRLISVHSNG